MGKIYKAIKQKSILVKAEKFTYNYNSLILAKVILEEKKEMFMNREMILEPIAHIENDFPAKFGIPRQSGLTDAEAKIIFEPEYRVVDAFRGLEEYSHIWLLWGFSEVRQKEWSPTVRPPRLGGNTRVGVFATRSPFRPNPVGLSCVKLDRIDLESEEGPILYVTGADLMNGTPIYDIKPYLPYVDSHPEAAGGFSDRVKEYGLKVDYPAIWREKLDEKEFRVLCQILSQDPRPSYQNDPERIYGMEYAGLEVKFTVDGDTLHVCGIYTAGEAD